MAERKGGNTVGNESPFSPKQVDRLNRFAHMVARSDLAEDLITAGQKPILQYVSNRKKIDVFDITKETVYVIRKTASNMYRDEFMPDPLLKEAADSILEERKHLQRETKKQEDDALKKMWDN